LYYNKVSTDTTKTHQQTNNIQTKGTASGSYLRRQQSKFKSIASQIDEGAMPLSSYSLMHKNARLTKEVKALIFIWAQQTKDSLIVKK
jgi:Haem-binding domain